MEMFNIRLTVAKIHYFSHSTKRNYIIFEAMVIIT